jgi:hypothetical protein
VSAGPLASPCPSPGVGTAGPLCALRPCSPCPCPCLCPCLGRQAAAAPGPWLGPWPGWEGLLASSPSARGSPRLRTESPPSIATLTRLACSPEAGGPARQALGDALPLTVCALPTSSLLGRLSHRVGTQLHGERLRRALQTRPKEWTLPAAHTGHSIAHRCACLFCYLTTRLRKGRRQREPLAGSPRTGLQRLTPATPRIPTSSWLVGSSGLGRFGMESIQPRAQLNKEVPPPS